jgi:hypothetical protein
MQRFEARPKHQEEIRCLLHVGFLLLLIDRISMRDLTGCHCWRRDTHKVRLIISGIPGISFPVHRKARGQVPPTHSCGPDVTTTGTTTIAITPVIGSLCIVHARPPTSGNDDALCNVKPCRIKMHPLRPLSLLNLGKLHQRTPDSIGDFTPDPSLEQFSLFLESHDFELKVACCYNKEGEPSHLPPPPPPF